MKKFAAMVLAAVCLLAGAQGVALADDYVYGTTFEKETPQKGEVSREKIINIKKEVVGRNISFADGGREMQTLNAKGNVTQKFRWDKRGKRVSEHHYYEDGKLKQEFLDGVLRFERRKLADGTFEAIRFKEDGKSPQMRRRVGPNGEFELVHYRTGKSNEKYFSATMKGTSGDPEWTYYAKDGSTLRRVKREDSMVVTVYDKNGNFKLEQAWSKKDDGSYVIQSATERHNNGFRRYVVDDKGALKSAEDLDLDGSVKTTWKADHVTAPAATIFTEQYEDDDPTIPGDDD